MVSFVVRPRCSLIIVNRFQTLVMFSGEALCLVFFGFQRWRASRRESSGVINEGDPLLSMPKDDVLQDSGKV